MDIAMHLILRRKALKPINSGIFVFGFVCGRLHGMICSPLIPNSKMQQQ
jgi:F420-0:gamma-glutamyl ligase-like protein